MGGQPGPKDSTGRRKSDPEGGISKRTQRRPARPRRSVRQPTREPSENDEGHLRRVVEALWALEEGRPLASSELPTASAEFFLDHAEHFRPVAFGALRLLKWLALRGDEARRIRVARALDGYVEAHAARVEQVLLLICADAPSAVLRDAIAVTLANVLAQAERTEPLATRWSERSEEARDVLARARKRWVRERVGAFRPAV